MVFQTYIPSYPLNLFIKDFFYYEGFNPEHNVDRFLPDGNTEMIIDLTADPKYIYDNESLKEIQACHNVWVSGIRTEYITIPSGKESRMIVITFRKGKAHPFYPMPVNELTDYVVDADLLYGSAIAYLRERVLSSKSIDFMFKLVEDFLYKIAGNKLQSNVPVQCIDFAISSIVCDPAFKGLENLSNKIGYSQKHFINLFKKQVGVSPKAFMKILRFQNVLFELEKPESISWNKLAFDSGYYDQAHFNNDFKLFSGFTPNEYLAKKATFLNYVPVG